MFHFGEGDTQYTPLSTQTSGCFFFFVAPFVGCLSSSTIIRMPWCSGRAVATEVNSKSNEYIMLGDDGECCSAVYSYIT